MKKYAMKVLTDVKPDSPYFITANRLIKFLKYFKDIPDKWVPCNSLLREFIGGSIFYDN
jgi:uridine kinase